MRLSERESSHSRVPRFPFRHVESGWMAGEGEGERGEDEVWSVRGRYTCNTTSFDTPYSITVVEAARIEGSQGV